MRDTPQARNRAGILMPIKGYSVKFISSFVLRVLAAGRLLGSRQLSGLQSQSAAEDRLLGHKVSNTVGQPTALFNYADL